MTMTRKTAIFSLIIVFSTMIFAQLSEKKSFRTGEFSFFVGTNTYSNIRPQKGFDHHYQFNRTRLHYGIHLGYRFSKRLSVHVGLTSSSVRYQADYKWSAQQVSDPALPVQTKADLYYTDIPVFFDFDFVSKDKLQLSAYAGLAPSFFMPAPESLTTFQDHSTSRFALINFKFNPAYLFGLSLQYKLNDIWTLKLQANYRYFQKGFDEIMYQHPAALRVSLGYVWILDWKCAFKKEAWNPLPVCE